MINKIFDNRSFPITQNCDAVIELPSDQRVSYEKRIVYGFQSESEAYIISFAKRLDYFVDVYLYDLNSKPLK